MPKTYDTYWCVIIKKIQIIFQLLYTVVYSLFDFIGSRTQCSVILSLLLYCVCFCSQYISLFRYTGSSNTLYNLVDDCVFAFILNLDLDVFVIF